MIPMHRALADRVLNHGCIGSFSIFRSKHEICRPESVRTWNPVRSPAHQGRNSWPDDNSGYRGPAPPLGSGPHRYVFRVYALDLLLSLPNGATKSQLLTAMEKHILAEGQLIGTYER